MDIGIAIGACVGVTVADAPGIRLGLSITLAIKISTCVEDRDNSLGSKVGGSSNLLGWSIVGGHSTIRVGHKTTIGVDSWGSNGGDNTSNMVNTGGVEEGGVSLSGRLGLGLGLTL